jgi:hypothetical protein
MKRRYGIPRWTWISAALIALILATMALGTAKPAIAQGPNPHLPSDAELNQLVQSKVADWSNGIPKNSSPTVSDIRVRRMHRPSGAGYQSEGPNWVVLTFTAATLPVNGYVYYSYILMYWNPPIPGITFGTNSGSEISWKSQDDAFALFMASRGTYNGLLPEWDTTFVYGAPTATRTRTPSASPSATPLALCSAKITVPANLKPGDTLSPSADVTSTDGKAVQGSLGLVWTINGVQANSVTWDGKAATIRLDLSCQGRAQSFNYTVPPYGITPTPGTPTPPVSPTPPPPTPTGPPVTPTRAVPAPNEPTAGDSDADAEGDVPGLGSAGGLPGPKDAGQGLAGGLLPGLLGLLGALLAGAGGTGATPAGAGGGPPPVVPVAPVAPAGGRGAGSAGAEAAAGAAAAAATAGGAGDGKGDGKGTGEKPKPDGGKTVPVDPKSQAQTSAQKAAAAQAAAAGSDTWGGALWDAASSGAYAVGKFAKDAGNVVVGAVKSVGTGVQGIADAVRNPGMFVKGLKAEISTMAAPARADAQAANQALKDGRFGDYAMSFVSGTGKIIGSLGSKALGIAGHIANQVNPKDEIASFFDPNASLEQKLWAIPSAALKVASLLLPTKTGWKPVGGVPAPSIIPAVAPAAAGQAARTAAGQATRAAAADGAAAARPAATSSGLAPADGGLQAGRARTLVDAPPGTAPSLKGMSKTQANSIADIAQETGTQIGVRPGKASAVPWRQSGRGLPKGPDIHVGSLNEVDGLIGGPSGKDGVGHFKPELPPNLSQLGPEAQAAIKERFGARMKEWNTYAGQMQRLQQAGKIRVIDGMVYDGPTGKPLVSDNDLAGIFRNGVPVPADEAQLILGKIRRVDPTVTHGPVNNYFPPGKEGIKVMNDTIGKHLPGSTEPLAIAGPDGKWTAGYFGDKVAP